MKNIFYTALLTTALSLPAAYSFAQTDSMSDSDATSGRATGSMEGTMNNSTDAAGSEDTTTGTLDSTTDTTAGTLNDNSATTGAATNTTTDTTGAEMGVHTAAEASVTGSADMNTNVSVSSLNETQVRQIQTALRDAGFTPGRIDGVWGPRTAASLERFQQQRGLDRAQSVASDQASPALIHAETLQNLGIGLNEMQPAAGSGTTGTSGSSTGLDGMDNTMNSDDVIDNDRLESNGME